MALRNVMLDASEPDRSARIPAYLTDELLGINMITETLREVSGSPTHVRCTRILREYRFR